MSTLNRDGFRKVNILQSFVDFLLSNSDYELEAEDDRTATFITCGDKDDFDKFLKLFSNSEKAFLSNNTVLAVLHARSGNKLMVINRILSNEGVDEISVDLWPNVSNYLFKPEVGKNGKQYLGIVDTSDNTEFYVPDVDSEWIKRHRIKEGSKVEYLVPPTDFDVIVNRSASLTNRDLLRDEIEYLSDDDVQSILDHLRSLNDEKQNAGNAFSLRMNS